MILVNPNDRRGQTPFCTLTNDQSRVHCQGIAWRPRRAVSWHGPIPATGDVAVSIYVQLMKTQADVDRFDYIGAQVLLDIDQERVYLEPQTLFTELPRMALVLPFPCWKVSGRDSATWDGMEMMLCEAIETAIDEHAHLTVTGTAEDGVVQRATIELTFAAWTGSAVLEGECAQRFFVPAA